MTNRIRELFEQEARDLDPRWQAIERVVLTRSGGFNAESADASLWPVTLTRPWSSSAGVWLADVNRALNDPAAAGDAYYLALGNRFNVVGGRQAILTEKGLGQNKFDLLGSAVEGFQEGLKGSEAEWKKAIKIAAGVYVGYLVLKLLLEFRKG